jgi:hypothetical protein
MLLAPSRGRLHARRPYRILLNSGFPGPSGSGRDRRRGRFMYVRAWAR